MRLSQVAQRSPLSQASQSQEERATCLAGKAAYRALLRSRLKNAQRSRMNAQAAVTASASRAYETHHRSLLRNVRNAVATAKSKAIETFDRRRARQSRDAAATATARAAETLLRRGIPRQSCSEQPAMPATLQRLLLPETPRTHRQGQTDFQGLLQTWPMCAYHKFPKLAAYASSGDIQSLAAARDITHPSSSFWSFLAFNYDFGINLTTRDDLNVGSMTCVCQFCNARKWAGDPAGLCCCSGKVRLPPLHEPPTPLRGLIAGSHPDSSHFLKTIRQYNNSFRMTSFGAQVVREEGWMPTFKVQRQVYHRIGSLLPEETSTPKFLQLYFIADYNLQSETRIGILSPSGRVPRRDVILLLQAMLHEVHSTATFAYDGYHLGIPLHTPGGQPTTTSKALSCKAFYSYRFIVRDGYFNLLHRCREIFHQFAVDMAAKMKSERLCFIRNHQKQLRSDSYVHNSLRNEVNPRDLGKLCILPSTYTERRRRVTCMNARKTL
ncbi:unnamed protein product [Acanthosepion pharaonis]|uniref:Helitron helicase-like domain-containing protein n=1 Tax=Acanthosepion pharaonis TaxID=158019 RepID=A0A812C1C5_ACAPH|nr:unnamed protein product [Sepia pharaonis]